MGGGVHDSYTFQCGLVGSFPMAWTPDRGDRWLSVSPPKDTGKVVRYTELAKFRSEVTAAGFEPDRERLVATPSQRCNPLGHRAPQDDNDFGNCY